jgi:hypothetical protein
MQLELAVSAREQRRLIHLETRIHRIGDKIIMLRLAGYTVADYRLRRLIDKQRAALAEWHRLRWPR